MGLGDNGGNLNNVTFLHAGNNYGWIMCYGGEFGSGGQRYPFQAYAERVFNPPVYVTQVEIDGQTCL